MAIHHVPQETVQSPTRTRKWYSERDKADALEVVRTSGESLYAVSKKLGIPYMTLSEWASADRGDKPEMQPLASTQVRDESKRDHLAALKRARWLYLDRLSEDEAVAKTSGYYAAVTWKVLNEGIALAEGGATSRVELSLASFLTQASLPGGGDQTNPERGEGER